MKMISKKEKRNAKLGNDVKIYDIVSHRSFFVGRNDLLLFEECKGHHRICLKISKHGKTPNNCGYFWVGPVAYKTFVDRFPKVKAVRRKFM